MRFHESQQHSCLCTSVRNALVSGGYAYARQHFQLTELNEIVVVGMGGCLFTCKIAGQWFVGQCGGNEWNSDSLQPFWRCGSDPRSNGRHCWDKLSNAECGGVRFGKFNAHVHQIPRAAASALVTGRAMHQPVAQQVHGGFQVYRLTYSGSSLLAVRCIDDKSELAKCSADLMLKMLKCSSRGMHEERVASDSDSGFPQI